MTDCHRKNCPEMIENWRKSVIKKSALLPEGMELVSMHTIVPYVSSSFVDEFNESLLKLQDLRGLYTLLWRKTFQVKHENVVKCMYYHCLHALNSETSFDFMPDVQLQNGVV